MEIVLQTILIIYLVMGMICCAGIMYITLTQFIEIEIEREQKDE